MLVMPLPQIQGLKMRLERSVAKSTCGKGKSAFVTCRDVVVLQGCHVCQSSQGKPAKKRVLVLLGQQRGGNELM